MSYYVKHKGKVELTFEGQTILTHLGLSLSDLRNMSRLQLLKRIKEFKGPLDTGKTTKGSPVGFKNVGWHHSGNTKEKMTELRYQQAYDDEGSPFRFFDLDAWAEHHGFLDVAKPNRAERDMGLMSFQGKTPERYGEMKGTLDHAPNRQNHQKNIHPTCKPVKLMAYLIELGCPKNGVVVDPFLGSGTTCIAAKKLRRNWIGIEINPEYAEIAEARINIRGPLDHFMEAKKV